MARYCVMLLILVAVGASARAADMEALRDSARWLAEERLRGTLFHNPNVEPPRPILVQPTDASGRREAPTPIVLRGWHHLVILPDGQRRLAFRLKDLASET
ncbi:MAG: hypothetical protein ACE5JM_01935, partial [Armatimonadota bacterium]